MKLILTGATGTIGDEVLTQLLDLHEVQEVHALTRRPIMRTDEKLKQIFVRDLADYSSVRLESVDAWIWCLGSAPSDVSRAEKLRVSTDYALAAARALFESSPQARFCFLSTLAPETPQDSLFTKMKRRSEAELLALSPNVYRIRAGHFITLTEQLAEVLIAIAEEGAPMRDWSESDLQKCFEI